MIGFTNGCFDILHIGHIELLRYAKEQVDWLIVGLNSDSSVKKLKGKKRPINGQEDRKVLLEALRYVDEVIIFDEDTPLELMKKINPDIIFKGGDYKLEYIVGSELYNVKIIKYNSGYSTTNILNKLK